MLQNPEFGMEPVEREQSPSRFAQLLALGQRVHRIGKDPEVRQGVEAALRTLANAGIIVADAVPGGLGEIGSWTADAAKTVGRAFGWKQLDLTPDVSLAIALGSELAEAPTAGAAPSHAVEALMQLGYDIPRIREALKTAKEHWRIEQADFIDHKEELTGAMTAFGVTSPEVQGGTNG